MKLQTRFTIAILTVMVIVFMILPYVCYQNTDKGKQLNCLADLVYIDSTKHDTVTPVTRNFSTNAGVKGNKKYNFHRIMELEKRYMFERRKEELLYKLERRKARVYDKTVDIDAPFPPIAEEMDQVKRYFNVTGEKLTTLNADFVLCSKTTCSENPVLIVLIPSIPGNKHIREAIRSTYGSVGRYTQTELLGIGLEHAVKFAFLLGRSPNQTIQATVQAEHEEYDDIIQADFTDSYYNLTLKILYGFKWIKTFCKDVRYVLKADEDVFVNVRLLLAELKTYKVYDKGSVFGFIHSNSLGLRVLRTGKWGVSKAEYPLRRYPPYAQGTSYTLTGDLISKILAVAEQLPYLHIEDAFITGIIAGKLIGAKLEIILGNSYWTDETPDPCEFVKTERVSQTNMKPALMVKTWQALADPELFCAKATYRARVHRHNLA